MSAATTASRAGVAGPKLDHAEPCDGFRPRRLPPDAPPQEARFTLEEFRRIGETGVFDGCRVELVDGKVFMSPLAGFPHSLVVHRLRKWCERVFPEENFTVWQESAIYAKGETEVGPDITVVAIPFAEAAEAGRPARAELVIEVAQTSQQLDHGLKMRKYAQSGTPEYWVIDIAARNITVYRNPVPAAKAEPPYRYKYARTFGEDAVVSPRAAKDAKMNLLDMLPPARRSS